MQKWPLAWHWLRWLLLWLRNIWEYLQPNVLENLIGIIWQSKQRIHKILIGGIKWKCPLSSIYPSVFYFKAIFATTIDYFKLLSSKVLILQMIIWFFSSGSKRTFCAYLKSETLCLKLLTDTANKSPQILCYRTLLLLPYLGRRDVLDIIPTFAVYYTTTYTATFEFGV